MNKMKIYKDKDLKKDLLKNKKVGIIGYGNQGRAQALNLLDSGINVSIGLRNDSNSISIAKKDGFKQISSIQEITKKCNLLCILIPDEEIPNVYEKSIRKYLQSGHILVFAHGYCVNYSKIYIPNFIDVIMVAPSGAGKMVREKYLVDSGVPNLIAIHQDYSTKALEYALSYSKNIGGTKVGCFISSFEEETVTDIFGEQAILTGGLPKLIAASFDALVESGYSPIVSWFVCYYEVKSIIDLFHKDGFEFLNDSISNIAEYGGATRGDYLIDDNIKIKMKKMITEIQNGKFVKEWDNEQNDKSSLKYHRNKTKKSHIEKMNKKMLKILFDK